MISTVTEYVHVTGENIDADHPHGDLDRILIDGSIMPLRDEELDPEHPEKWKNATRGEDIAFLAEATAERLRAARKYYATGLTFNREFRASQPAQVLRYIRSMCGLDGSRSQFLIDGDVEFAEQIVTPSAYGRSLSILFPDRFYSATHYGDYWDADHFVHGAQIVREPIERLFDELQRLESFEMVEVAGKWHDLTATRSGTPGAGGGPYPPEPPLTEADRLTFYRFQYYRVENSSGVVSENSYDLTDRATAGRWRVQLDDTPALYGVDACREIRLYNIVAVEQTLDGQSQTVYVLVDFGAFTSWPLYAGTGYCVDLRPTQTKLESILAIAGVSPSRPTGEGSHYERIEIRSTANCVVGKLGDRTTWPRPSAG